MEDKLINGLVTHTPLVARPGQEVATPFSSDEFIRDMGPSLGKMRLRELKFSDIWISEYGHALLGGADNAQGPIVNVPNGLIIDLDPLRLEVMRLGQLDKEFAVVHDGIRYRVARFESVTGIWYTLRRSKGKPPRFKQIGGIPIPVKRHLASLGEEPNKGLILMAGSTGQGKTTTLSSLFVEYLTRFGGVGITIEDPEELELDGPHGEFGICFQQRLARGDTFGNALVYAMRQSPRFILVSEMRKPADASEVLRSAISGHIIMSTIHAGSPIEAIASLIKLVSAQDGSAAYAQEQVAAGLAVVVHQRLVKQYVDGKLRMRLIATPLFMGRQGSVMRSLVREGKLNQLQTSIDQQLNRVRNNLDPIHGEGVDVPPQRPGIIMPPHVSNKR